jgi:hypothetical protein
VKGAAWALLCSSLVTGSVAFYISQRYYPIRWELGKVAPLFGIVCLSTVLLVVLPDAPYAVRLFVKAASLAAYLAAGARFGIITGRNLRLVLAAATLRTAAVPATAGAYEE